MSKHDHTEDDPTPDPTPDPAKDAKDRPGVVTRADLKGDEKPTEPAEAVTLTAPGGTKVTVSPDQVDDLKSKGYS